MVKILKKKLYTAGDLSNILPLSYVSILEYLKKGKIIGTKIGQFWYVTEGNLNIFLEGGNNK